jgi:hypothetical protein
MSNTTFEEASKCPKCGEYGEESSKKPTRDGRGRPIEVITLLCRNASCKWFGTGWFIQVNEDGSIPEAYSGVRNSDKHYPKLSQESASKIEDNILRQLELETKPGTEVRNPNGN